MHTPQNKKFKKEKEKEKVLHGEKFGNYCSEMKQYLFWFCNLWVSNHFFFCIFQIVFNECALI